MKAHRRKRLGVILFVAAGLSVAIGLTLYALSQNIDLFYTPTQVAQGEVNAGGQGIVVEGSLDAAGVFQASRVLAKHDENYMSPEVKAALDAAGTAPESAVTRPGT